MTLVTLVTLVTVVVTVNTVTAAIGLGRRNPILRGRTFAQDRRSAPRRYPSTPGIRDHGRPAVDDGDRDPGRDDRGSGGGEKRNGRHPAARFLGFVGNDPANYALFSTPSTPSVWPYYSEVLSFPFLHRPQTSELFLHFFS